MVRGSSDASCRDWPALIPNRCLKARLLALTLAGAVAAVSCRVARAADELPAGAPPQSALERGPTAPPPLPSPWLASSAIRPQGDASRPVRVTIDADAEVQTYRLDAYGFQPLCLGPCQLDMPGGAQRLALSGPDGNILIGQHRLQLQDGARVQAVRESANPTRTAGILVLSVGLAAGIGMIVGSVVKCLAELCDHIDQGLVVVGGPPHRHPFARGVDDRASTRPGAHRARGGTGPPDAVVTRARAPQDPRRPLQPCSGAHRDAAFLRRRTQNGYGRGCSCAEIECSVVNSSAWYRCMDAVRRGLARRHAHRAWGRNDSPRRLGARHAVARRAASVERGGADRRVACLART